MRFLALLLLVVLIIAVADARGRRKTTRRPPTPAPTCRGLPPHQVCFGDRDEGNSGRDCDRNANNRMWYYNHSSRTCIEFRYRGCGGNGNRYCSRVDCENKCRR